MNDEQTRNRSTAAPTRWAARVAEHLETLTPGQAREYAQAHHHMIGLALAGHGPDERDSCVGARPVCNIPSAHVRAFCEGGYKNGYDLGKLRVGAEPVDQKPRTLLDRAIAKQAGCQPDGIYYAAAELNGSGVRFYGDVCLALRDVEGETLVLDRNSYDLMRQPLRTKFNPAKDDELEAQVEQISGRWKADLTNLTTMKVFATPQPSGRRITTGQVSEGLLSDEDYVEVILTRSFGASEVHEARLNAVDATADEHIRRRAETGPVPSPTALKWVVDRDCAIRELGKKGLTIRVVVNAGRTRA